MRLIPTGGTKQRLPTPLSLENAEILVLCQGRPIAEPDDVRYILSHTRGVVGFFGASSMERLPTEPAITGRVREFKSLPAPSLCCP